MIVWKLDALMRQRRVKGRQLAKRMGIGENYLSRVRHEVPDRLSLSLLDSLCRELNCTIADLLEYDPTPAPAQPAPAPEPVAEAPAAVEAPAPVAVVEAVVEAEPEPEPEPEPEMEVAPEPEPEPEAPPPAPVRPRLQIPLMASLTSGPAFVPEAAAPPAPEPEPAPEAGAAYVKVGALQAKLNRLKRRG